mmetsp:Transcript_21451/g.51849  ORF Transcript_21451/g.51849 Transcript_21451/m.51849 type:complete len:133 (+) Transcript_21451:697-1095(+)
MSTALLRTISSIDGPDSKIEHGASTTDAVRVRARDNSCSPSRARAAARMPTAPLHTISSINDPDSKIQHGASTNGKARVRIHLEKCTRLIPVKLQSQQRESHSQDAHSPSSHNINRWPTQAATYTTWCINQW